MSLALLFPWLLDETEIPEIDVPGCPVIELTLASAPTIRLRVQSPIVALTIDAAAEMSLRVPKPTTVRLAGCDC